MKPISLLCFYCLFFISTFGQQKYWQQELFYKIDVTLNDKEHSLDGFLELQYTNHSPDTLDFIWFHLWPNAFRNDKTAFSEQLLENGRTDFYFSGREQKGYINKFDFRINNATLKIEDHPRYSDIIKVYLPSKLAPGQQVKITTPFYVKLPDNFSRSGHNGTGKQSYQITQWYPKPAVYDRKGWHPMPYLQQGEFYSEFGTFDVRISLPSNYVVAATGELQNAEELEWLKKKGDPPKLEKVAKKVTSKQNTLPFQKAKTEFKLINSSTEFKTLRYLQDDIHDFAWFADKYFGVKHDTVRLQSGKIVDAFSYYHEAGSKVWANSISFIKAAIHFRSALIGEYPYKTVSVVEADMGFTGGMEYPTITSISPTNDEGSLDRVIEHEIGHNWFYGILGTNEREYPWLDEGVNSYYGNRYSKEKYPQTTPHSWPANAVPDDPGLLLLSAVERIKKDQPITTSSPGFTELNYGIIAYTKAADWLKMLENELGTETFDRCMQAYYSEWKFRHPQPEDFRSVMEKTSGKDLSHLFALLEHKGSIHPPQHKKLKPAFLFSARNTEKINYINIMPAIGYNKYDGFMVGALIHNYNIVRNRFSYAVAPLYATGSRELNGIGGLYYSWYPDSRFQKIRLGIEGARFSTLSGVDSNAKKIFGGFYKIVPSLRVTFNNAYARSSIEKWIEWKTFLIGEQGFRYSIKKSDGQFYPDKAKVEQRYLNQLTFNVTNYRVLYPYDIQLQAQQSNSFYRLNLNSQYFFNYPKGGGMQVRLFAAKFGYIGERTTSKEFQTSRYQPKLTAVRGDEDYTYSNYFIGRNEAEGFASQQIMMRDGGFKLRTDMFQDLQGRSDNWIAAMNFSTSLPKKIFPIPIPIRVFLDIGTYSDAWKTNAATSKFLYVAGLQLSLFKNLLNVYAPVIYSTEFKDNLKTVPEENKFFKKISFSIDIQRFNLRRITGNKVPF